MPHTKKRRSRGLIDAEFGLPDTPAVVDARREATLGALGGVPERPIVPEQVDTRRREFLESRGGIDPSIAEGKRAEKERFGQAQSAERTRRAIENRRGVGTPESEARIRAADLRLRDEGKIGLREGERIVRDKINARNRRLGLPQLAVKPSIEPIEIGADDDISGQPQGQNVTIRGVGYQVAVSKDGQKHLLPTKQDAVGNQVLDTQQIDRDVWVLNATQDEVNQLTDLARRSPGVRVKVIDLLSQLGELDALDPGSGSLGDRIRAGDIDGERERLEKELRRLLYGFSQTGAADAQAIRDAQKQDIAAEGAEAKAVDVQQKEQVRVGERGEDIARKGREREDDIVRKAAETQRVEVKKDRQVKEQRERDELNAILKEAINDADAEQKRRSATKTDTGRVLETQMDAKEFEEFVQRRIDLRDKIRKKMQETIQDGEGAGLPVVSNQVEYDALESGTEYIDPDGIKRTKL